jgi:hypothetical protein
MTEEQPPVSGHEIRWDRSVSNWKRYHRRFVGPFIAGALEQAKSGITDVGLDSRPETILLTRCVSTDKEYAISYGGDADIELYLPVTDIKHRKLARRHDLWVQVMFHEHVHWARRPFFGRDTLLEYAADEGLAYCATQQFAASTGIKDEFAPIDFMRTLPRADQLAIRAEVFAAHATFGSVAPDELDVESEFFEWTHSPYVKPYSATEVVGICAVANMLDQGYSVAELVSMPAEELLQAA